MALIKFDYAPVAQLVEQWPLKPLVVGSSPSWGTKSYETSR